MSIWSVHRSENMARALTFSPPSKPSHITLQHHCMLHPTLHSSTTATKMKEDVVVTTITVHSMEQNVIVMSILWSGYFLAFVTTAWRIYKSSHKAQQDEASSGDTTRLLFYQLLGVALLSRLIFIPVQNLANGQMLALISETLPQLTFASAWALLVTFFVNLVGTASGGSAGSSTPSLLLHIAVYLAYIVLVVWYWWNDAAAVLLYALLCIIYASLFITLAYFGPKLVVLLHPSLERQSGLSMRLIACCTIGVLVFLTQSISLAQTVVLPKAQAPFWITCGLCELLPSTILLIMMHPFPPKSASPPELRRIPSGESTSTAGNKTSKSSSGEMTALLKPQPPAQYGSSKSPIDGVV